MLSETFTLVTVHNKYLTFELDSRPIIRWLTFATNYFKRFINTTPIMNNFFVHEVFRENEIEVINQPYNLCQIGIVNIKGNKALFYSETMENNGCRFGFENYHGLKTLFNMAEETDDSCILLLFLSSVGANLKERTKALDYYAEIFKSFIYINKRYLTISIVSGNCVGGSAYLASLCDVLLFSKQNGNLCLTGPKIVQNVLGFRSNKKQLGGYETQSASGTVSKVFKNADDCRADIEFFINARGKQKTLAVKPKRILQDADCEFNNRAYDMMKIIDGIIDSNSNRTLFSDFGKSVITMIARIEGKYTGVIANQPLFGWGAIDTFASEKMARFIRLCSKIQLPLLLIADVPSFLPGEEQELRGIQWRGADFLREMILYEEKKVTLIIHKSYGGAYIAMNSIRLGATAVYAWKNAQIGIMGVSAEKEIYGESFSEYEISLSAYENYEHGSLTGIIEPENTRKILYDTLWE